MNDIDKYLKTLFVGTKFERPSPVKDGAAHPSIESWDTHAGFSYVTRSSPPRRSSPPEFNAPIDPISGRPIDWDMFMSMVIKVVEIKSRPIAQTERGRIQRQESIDELEIQINEYVKARSALTSWEFREIARCIDGHGTMCGFHYFYFNYGWIFESKEGGGTDSIKPMYRRADDMILRAIDKSIELCRGLVGGKRRQFGFSWLLVMIVVYTCLFRDGIVFFVTKDDNDKEKFFKRLTHFYNGIPHWLQKPKNEDARDTRSYTASWRIDLVKEQLKRKGPDEATVEARIRTGSVKAVGSLAGDTVSLFVMDEPGEIKNHDEIWEIIEPALKKGNSRKRAGCFIGLGTVGRMDRYGKQFKSFYKSASAFKLDKYQIWGWMGMEPDECGNEPKEDIIRDINETVEALKAAGKQDLAIAERQKYPLQEEDMFLSSMVGKILPAIELGKARDQVEESGIHKGLKYGLFYFDPETNTVKFEQQEPSPSPIPVDRPDYIGYGQWVLREDPQDLGYKEAYCGGCDPVDMDKDRHRESDNNTNLLLSDISFVIHKRIGVIGGDNDLPVALYTGRPADVDDAYYQAYLAALHYKCKWNIERQKGHRMYAYLKTMPGGLELIATGTGVASGQNSKVTQWGYSASEAWWNEGLGMTKKWIKKNWHMLGFIRLIYECENAKEQNTDALVAWMAALQYAHELDVRSKLGIQRDKTTVYSPGKTSLFQRINGKTIPTRALKSPGILGHLTNSQAPGKETLVTRISRKVNR